MKMLVKVLCDLPGELHLDSKERYEFFSQIGPVALFASNILSRYHLCVCPSRAVTLKIALKVSERRKIPSGSRFVPYLNLL